MSRRCTQRQFLLRPDEHVTQTFLYCLGEAVDRFGVTLHGWIAMSNHQHLVARDNDGNYPAFLAHLNKMLAKALNAHWGRWENLWATEQPNVVHLLDASDRFDKLIYILANPVNDHLVERAADWPGASSLAQVLSGRSITVKRPPKFFSDEGPMPDQVTLCAERPADYEDLTQDEWSKKVLDALADVERKARDVRREKNIGILGRKAVLGAKHTDTPSTVEPRRRLRPNVAAKDPERRVAALGALRAFREAYREALVQWVAKVESTVFPAGTYRLRLFGVPCHPFTVAQVAPS